MNGLLLKDTQVVVSIMWYAASVEKSVRRRQIDASKCFRFQYGMGG